MTDSLKQSLEKRIRHLIKQTKTYQCPIGHCQYTDNNKVDLIHHVLDKHTALEILE